MKYLHQHMFWRVDKLRADEASLPSEGEELWIAFRGRTASTLVSR